MRIRNIEFGLIKFHTRQRYNRFKFAEVCHCGCISFELGPLYFTYLRGECWPVQLNYGAGSALTEDDILPENASVIKSDSSREEKS